MHQLHIADLGTHAGHTLGLFRAQVKGETQAVFGDHHRDIAGFLMGLKRGFNQFNTKTFIEGAGLVVVNTTTGYPGTPEPVH